jgi:signal transduction histidine kinase
MPLLGLVRHAGPVARIARSGRTVWLRFTALYAGAFVASGVALLGLTVLLGSASINETEPAGGGHQQPVSGQVRALQRQLDQVHQTQTRQLLVAAVVALVVMAVVSVLLGGAVARRVLRPLRRLTAATRRISAANLHERLAVPGPSDEVKDLADTIDGLLARLEGSFAAQRRFVADASHELRTPLATMRAQLDVAAAKPDPAPQLLALTTRLRTELDRVDGLLEGLLVLARTEHGALGDRTEVALADLVEESVGARRDTIDAKDLEVELDLPAEPAGGDARVPGNAVLLARLVGNLVDNAVTHNVPGGWIRGTVRRFHTEGPAGASGHAWVRLVVESGGPVLEPAQVARLAEPFRRLVADRTGSDTGSGLGLPIVAGIAAAHGGRLDLAAPPTGGLTATVWLPAAVEGAR